MYIKPFEFYNFAADHFYLYEWLNEARNPEFFGGGQVWHIPYLMSKYTKDWKYLSQFPFVYWKHALWKRLSHDILHHSGLAQNYEDYGKLPPFINDYEKEIELENPNTGKKTKISHPKGGYMYTGSRELFDIINKPTCREELQNLDTNDEEQIKAYLAKGCHFYDYDTSAPMVAHPEDVDEWDDREVINSFSGQAKMRIEAEFNYLKKAYDKEMIKRGKGEESIKAILKHPSVQEMQKVLPKDQPELQQMANHLIRELAKQRKKLKSPTNLPHSTRGYTIHKPEIIRDMINAAITRTRLGLYKGERLKNGQIVRDENGKPMLDPVDNRPLTIEFMPVDEFIKEHAHGSTSFNIGHKPESKIVGRATEPMDEDNMKRMGIDPNAEIPVVYKHFMVNGKIEYGPVPYIPDSVVTPFLPPSGPYALNDWQRAMLAYRSAGNKQLGPGYGLNPKDPNFVNNYRLLDKQGIIKDYHKSMSSVQQLYNNIDLLDKDIHGQPIRHDVDEEGNPIVDEQGRLTGKSGKLKIDPKTGEPIKSQWDYIKNNMMGIEELSKIYHGGNRDIVRKIYRHGGVEHNKTAPMQPGIASLSKSDKEKVYRKYFNQMVSEAAQVIDKYISNLSGRLQTKTGEVKIGDEQRNEQIVAMLEGAAPELITVTAFLLLTHLNDYQLGIYDPSVGLTNPRHSDDPDEQEEIKEAARRGRIARIRSFIRSVEQYEMIGQLPRRKRKLGQRLEAEIEGEGEEVINRMDNIETKRNLQHMTPEEIEEIQRKGITGAIIGDLTLKEIERLRKEGKLDKGTYKLYYNPDTHRVARTGHNIPYAEYGDEAMAPAAVFFHTLRHRLVKQLDGVGQSQLDAAEQKILADFDEMRKLYDTSYEEELQKIKSERSAAEEEAKKRGMIPAYERTAEEVAAQNAQAKARARFEDIMRKKHSHYLDMDEETRGKLLEKLTADLQGRNLAQIAKKSAAERENEVEQFMDSLLKHHHAYYPHLIASSFNPPKEGDNAKVDIKPLANPSALLKLFQTFFREAVEKESIQDAINKFFLPVYLKAFALSYAEPGTPFSESEQNQILEDGKRVLIKGGYSFSPEMTQHLKNIVKEFPVIEKSLAAITTQQPEPTKIEPPKPTTSAVTPVTAAAAKPVMPTATPVTTMSAKTPITNIIQKIKTTSDPQQLTALINQQLIPMARQMTKLDPASIEKAYEELGEIIGILHGKLPEDSYKALHQAQEELANKLSW